MFDLAIPRTGNSLPQRIPLWNSLGENAGVASHSLLQGIFPIQGSNPHLLHVRIESASLASPVLQADSLPSEPSGNLLSVVLTPEIPSSSLFPVRKRANGAFESVNDTGNGF